jgi:hypothetical protein
VRRPVTTTAPPEIVVRAPSGEILFRRAPSPLELANAEHGMATPTDDMRLHAACPKFTVARSTLRFPDGLYWCAACSQTWSPEVAAKPAPVLAERIRQATAALVVARTRDHFTHIFGPPLPTPIGANCPAHATGPLVLKDGEAWCRFGQHWPLKEDR